MDRDVIEGKGCKNKQSSFKNMTELMCVYVWLQNGNHSCQSVVIHSC